MKITRVLVQLIAALALPILVFLEGGMTGSSYYPRVSQPPGLLAHEKEYLNWVTNLVQQFDAMARRRRRRALIIFVLAAVCGTAFPVIAISGLPGWVGAALAAVAGLAVSLQQGLRDHKLYLIDHRGAVDLQAAIRDFRFRELNRTSRDLRRRFEDFHTAAEAIKQRHDGEVFRLMKVELPIQIRRSE